LERLKQTDTCEDYITAFRTQARKTGFNSTALVNIFKRGLKEKILTRIYGMVTLPDTLEGWYRAAIRYDRQGRELQHFLSGNQSQSYRGQRTTTTTPTKRDNTGTVYGGSGQLMEIGRAK
jgi:hypothetical protein